MIFYIHLTTTFHLIALHEARKYHKEPIFAFFKRNFLNCFLVAASVSEKAKQADKSSISDRRNLYLHIAEFYDK